jgi:hypothetical protein
VVQRIDHFVLIIGGQTCEDSCVRISLQGVLANSVVALITYELKTQRPCPQWCTKSVIASCPFMKNGLQNVLACSQITDYIDIFLYVAYGFGLTLVRHCQWSHVARSCLVFANLSQEASNALGNNFYPGIIVLNTSPSNVLFAVRE